MRTLEIEGKNLQLILKAEDLRESNSNLQKSYSLLNATLESTADGILVVDKAGKITNLNRKFVELWSIPESIILSHDDEQAIAFVLNQLTDPKSFLAKVNELYADDLATSFDVLEFKDGRTFERYSQPQLFEGTNVGRVWSFRDITEHIQSQELLKNSEAALLELNAAKDKFFSIIAHDLRSPFSGFLGLTEILAEDLSGFTMEQVQGYAVNMRNSAKGIYNLLENLLQWARLQQDSVAFNVQVLQLHQIVADCVAISAESARKKDIELAFNVPDDLTVLADSNILQTIIRNLVSNALKFTLRHGQVTVKAKAIDERDVEVAVKDTGIGMNSAMVNNLFRLDVKTNRNGTEGEASSGLGLLLCKEFVEKLGGKIWVESEETKGTTFYFSLPRQLTTAADSAGNTPDLVVAVGTPSGNTSADFSGKRFLVAEDNVVNMKVAVLTLKKLTQHVYSAVNGLEAVDIFNKEKPDVILMDIHMPEMDGIEATLKIREIEKQQQPDKPVIIISMSATTNDEDIQKCMDAGMDTSLAKPFKINDLVNVLKSI